MDKAQIIHAITLTSRDGESLRAGTSSHPDPSGWWLGEASSGAMEGWWAPPPPRAESVDRPQADGAFAPAHLLVGARVLTLVLHHVGVSQADEQQARALIAALARGWLRVVVEEEGATYHVRAFSSAHPKVTHHSGQASTWSLVLTCPDPLKYEGAGSDDGSLTGWHVVEYAWRDGEGGALFPAFDQSPREDVTTSSSPNLLFTGVRSLALEVNNTGGLPVWPVLEAVGPVGRISWRLGGQIVQWRRPIPSGALLRIDTKTGLVTINGQRERLSGLSEDDFFTLPVGESVVALDMDRPALARVRWLPAWM